MTALSDSVVEGDRQPVGFTLAGTWTANDGTTKTIDLQGATVAIEVYRADGTTEGTADGWAWTTTTAGSAGASMVGYVSVPASPGGFNRPSEVVRMRPVVTLSGGSIPYLYQVATITVTPRHP